MARFARKEFDEASDWFWLSDVPTVEADSIYAIGITKRKKEEMAHLNLVRTERVFL